jgi:lambda family phage tail tape measure protein
VKFNALGNAYAANGIVPFAMGGIVNKPTLFKFANGGVPGTGLMGEAGPEAIIPLKRGPDGKLGVSGGGGVSVGEINITVQNSGETLSPAAQKQIANQVQGIVLTTLVNQKRSGGIL